MRIEFGRNIEKYIKSKINSFKISQNDFTIISNNCWGTFIYKMFGLNYKSPFINLLIYAPDYMELLENFSPDILQDITFIDYEKSKYKDEILSKENYNIHPYPVGLLDGKYELHFFHYTKEKEARDNWKRRVSRMNFNKLIFKNSEVDLFDESIAIRFDNLKFKNKICFTAKEYPDLKSMIPLDKYKNESLVCDEWKHSKKELDIVDFINNLELT